MASHYSYTEAKLLFSTHQKLNFIFSIWVPTRSWLCSVNLGEEIQQSWLSHTAESLTSSSVYLYLSLVAHGHLYLGLSFNSIRTFQWILCSTIHLLVVCSQWFFHIVKQKHFPASELACLIMGCCEIQTLLTSEVKLSSPPLLRLFYI